MLSQFLYKAKSSFLRFWADKTNRTTVVNFEIATNQTTKEIQVPYGTWKFEIKLRATVNSTSYAILMQSGQIDGLAMTLASSTGTNNFVFDGQPYIERSDRFKIRNIQGVGPSIIFVTIIYHRVMKANT